MATKGPKPWPLGEEEDFSSFCKWQAHLIHCLRKEETFKPYLKADAKWTKVRSGDPKRGLEDEDAAGVCNEMLGAIAQWVPHYLSHEIINESTDLACVWQAIRKYYGFQQSESQFLALSKITWDGPDKERPERLYRRVLAHLHDNLLHKGSPLKHDGATLDKNEDISPTVERLAVLRWLELIDPRLPSLVSIKYSADLQMKTLKDLQPQIVSGLDGLLEELRRDDVQVARVDALEREAVEAVEDLQVSRFRSKPHKPNPSLGSHTHRRKFTPREQQRQKPRKECRLCKSEGRSYIGHSIGTCRALSYEDKLDFIKSCKVVCEEQDEDQEVFCDDE